MTSTAVLFILLGACAGGFLNGLAGTGTALFALGFLLVALDPVSAVAVVTLQSVITGLMGLWEVRAALRVNVARLMRFIVPGLLGVPVGLMLLQHISADGLKLIVAILLVVYGGFFSFRSTLPKFERRTPVMDATVGLSGGIMSGMAGLSGALPVIWCSLRPWPKAEIRAVLQPFNVVILLVTSTMLWMRGAYDSTTVTAFLIALPASLFAAQVGLLVFRRVSDSVFRRLLIGLSLVLGLALLVDALW